MKRYCLRLAVFALIAALLLGGGASSETADAAAREITSSCVVRVSEGTRKKLTDSNVKTAWEYENLGAWIGIGLPDGITPGVLVVEWMFEPEGYELLEYDADQNLIRQRNQDMTFPAIVNVYKLRPETKYIRLTMTVMGQEVSGVHVYTDGALPDDLQVWNAPVTKADLMVVSAHQDDELIFFGGTIPYYAVARELPTVVVYMANCTRNRRREALEALWEMGVRDYPEFINMRDHRAESAAEAIELWEGQDNILKQLVQRIRRFKPEVIVTHDFGGEYGHWQHRLTAKAMMYAIDAAADPTQYPESYNAYGAWQVKKLYHHLYGENQITMDWTTPLDSLGGESPLQVAQRGMQKHASQLKYYQVVEGGKYDNAKFGLYFTTVGEDVVGGDFFENIDLEASHALAAELARPADDGTSGYVTVTSGDAENVAEEDGTENIPVEETTVDAVVPESGEADLNDDSAAPAGANDADAVEPAEASNANDGPEVEDAGDTSEPADDQASESGTAEPARERGSGLGWVIAGVALAGCVAGGAAFWLRRRARRRRHHRRRRG